MKNKELEKFNNCLQLAKENYKYKCSKCIEPYTIVKNNNIKECIYIRTLYDPLFTENYKNHYFYLYPGSEKCKEYSYYSEKDYIYNKYYQFSKCQEAENLGTMDNPLYSCKKCLESLSSYDNPVLINDINFNLSYCISSEYINSLENCLEATYQIKNGMEEYNCIKCQKNYVLNINEESGKYYCRSGLICQFPYCNSCNPHDGYACEECFPDYEKNKVTGECLKKTAVALSITWKDIYYLNKKCGKIINNKYYSGPTIRLRGITSSQINSGHVFLINFVYKKKVRIRNLEDEKGIIKIPGICEILNEIEETNKEVNLVDYECVCNKTIGIDLFNYILDYIEEVNDDNLLKRSNLNELALNL